MLQKEGYRVDTAHSVAELIASADWSACSLLVIDLALPDGTVEDLLPEVRRRAPQAAIVVMTEHADVDQADHLLEIGVADHLLKPIDPDQIHISLSRMVQRQRLHEQFHLALEATTHGMALIARDGRIVLVNSALTTLFGYGRHELIGQLVEILVPERFRAGHPQLRDSFWQQSSIRALGTGREVVGRHRDGRDLPLEIGLNPVRTDEGEFVLVSVVDITQRKQFDSLRETQIQIKLARAVQQDLLPKKAPQIPGCDIFGAAYPADAAGGDYFDFITWRDGSLGLVVGDVSGHGFASAVLMAVTRTYLRALSHIYADPEPIVNQTGQLLFHDTQGTDRFVSLFFARLDPQSRVLTYCGAGHRGYHINARGDVTFIESTGMVLGVVPETFIACGPPIWLKPGDMLLMPTDGFAESHSTSREMFGEERMLDVACRHRQQSARQIIEVLLNEVRAFAGGEPQADDITAVILKVAEP